MFNPSLSLFSQSLESPTNIKSSGEYFFGESCGENQSETKDFALSQLVSSISVTVSSDFRSMQTLVNDGENVDFENSVKNVVNTYTTAELNNLGQINEPRDCGIYVFLFIKKADVQKVFDSRKKLVQSLYDTANDLAKDLNYGSALKYYYFANLLLNSIPETSIEYRGKNLSIDIPHKITSIIEATRFQIIKNDKVSDQKREITFRVTVDGNPVKSLDYKFFDGHSQVFANSRDGISRITLVGSSTRWNELTLTVKYKYYENREEIAAVGQLWGLVSAYNAKLSQKIRLDEPIQVTRDDIGIADVFTNQNLLITNNIGEEVTLNDTAVSSSPLATQIVDIQEAIPVHLDKLKGYFNSNVTVPEWELDEFLSNKLAQMKRFNNLELIDNSTRQNINNTYEGWEFRQLTGNTLYPSVNLRSSEYIVPDFDSAGTMVDVNFGTLDGLYDEFKRASTFGDDWDKRQVIVKFVEKYRTAYMTRDTDQLGVMFADEAVIIVGRVLQVDENDDKDFVLSQTNEKQPSVEYLQHTKEEFLTRQQILFNTKRDIHLGFTSFDIRKKNTQPGIFGVSMRQSYTSTNYSDEGYLFLLIDFNGDQPKIYVRAWQPQQWDEDSIIGLTNYRISFGD